MAQETLVPKDVSAVERIVQERLEETVRLEFKRQLPDSGKNDDVAKDLGAMANTDGGVIIYGIGQDQRGCASELCPFPVADQGERITLVAQTLDEPLSLASVQSIPSEGERRLGFLAVEVPRSERAPHLYKGAAWGRTPKGNTSLTRRQVGDLFARSLGFVQEFGLAVGRPGRLFAGPMVEALQERGPDGLPETRHDNYLLFQNDGESDIFDTSWEWVTTPEVSGAMPHVVEDPFPLPVFQRGVRVHIAVFLGLGESGNQQVRTRWRDEKGDQHEQIWPIALHY